MQTDSTPTNFVKYIKVQQETQASHSPAKMSPLLICLIQVATAFVVDPPLVEIGLPAPEEDRYVLIN